MASSSLRCIAGPATSSLSSSSSSSSSAARIFIQLSAQSRPATADFLLPSVVRARTRSTQASRPHLSVAPPSLSSSPLASSSSSSNKQTTAQATTRPPALSPLRPRRRAITPPSSSFLPRRRRAFSTTPTRAATHALFNPAQDEDGNDMSLEITPRAAKRLSQIMQKDSNPFLALRIQVESGGCHGFQYLMKLVTLPGALPSGTGTSTSTAAAAAAAASTPPAADSPAAAATSSAGPSIEAIREDDTIFTFAKDDGAGAGATKDLTAPKIILDAPSLELLKGSKVDYTMELIGSQFKIVDNPLATSSCGCGTSFDIKI